MQTSTLTKAASRIRSWRERPAQFVHEEFGIDPDPWQLQVLDAFPSQDPDKVRIALQACAGPGKSAVLAWCGWNFLSCYAALGEHPKGAVVSITRDNLKDNLWAELSKWQERSEFLKTAFEWTSDRICAKDHPETWFISARSWPKSANAEEQGRTLSGLHAKFVLYLIDESGDIAPAVLKSAEQGLSNCEWGKIMQAGNPTSHDGMLYLAATTQRHLWFLVSITGDPDDPMRSKRIDAQWAKEQISTYGRDNPWVMAYILGKFPPSSLNSLLGPDEVNAAMGKHLTEDKYGFAAKILGVDVARFGNDRTVIFPRQGLATFKPVVMRNAKTHEIAARVAMAKDRWGADAIMVDDTGGWGAGVIDCLEQAGHPVMPVQFAGKPNDSRYLNKRAEIHFEAADWVKKSGGVLPNLPELVREATAAQYTFNKGKFQIEDKDQIIARLGFSPDIWEAFLITFSYNIAPPNRTGMPSSNSIGRATVDYDPIHRELGDSAGGAGRALVGSEDPADIFR